MRRAGRRVYPRVEDDQMFFREGDYGRDENGEWFCWPPGTKHMGSIKDHEVQEHEDGTITVTPSILTDEGIHVRLDRGVWGDA